MAPTARVCTRRESEERRGMSAGMAPSSRTAERPSLWKQMDWIAPAALACRSACGRASSLSSGVTPPAAMIRVTFSFS
eukprot:scaffold1583_cov105-Isochrysis_galbana.AAC.9